MKKILFLICVALIAAASSYLYRSSMEDFQTQLLNSEVTRPQTAESVSECQKLSENAANDCLFRLALEQKDESWCKEISKASKQRECERELSLQTQ